MYVSLCVYECVSVAAGVGISIVGVAGVNV